MSTALVCLSMAVLGLPAPAGTHEDLEIQIAILTGEIGRNPGNAELRLRRGELHRFHKDWAAARADYAEAERLDPALKSVDLARGMMEVESGDPAAALLALDRFLSVQPDHAEAIFTRGRALALKGAFPAAAEEFTRAIAKFSEPRPEHYLARADALAAAGAAYLDAALRGLEEGIRALGPLVVLELRAVDLEIAAGRTEAALERLDRQIAASERKDPWIVRKAGILQAAGRRADARAAYRAALDAIESLHPRQRHTRATREREQQAKTALEALNDAP